MQIFKVKRKIFKQVPSKDIKLGLKCEKFKYKHNIYQCVDNCEYWIIDIMEGTSYKIPKKQYERLRNRTDEDIIKYDYYTMGECDIYDIYSHNVIILTCPDDTNLDELKELMIYKYDKKKDKKELKLYFSSL